MAGLNHSPAIALTAVPIGKNISGVALLATKEKANRFIQRDHGKNLIQEHALAITTSSPGLVVC